jgi:hypothetical protein
MSALPTFRCSIQQGETAMEYMLLIYGNEQEWLNLPKADLEKGYKA